MLEFFRHVLALSATGFAQDVRAAKRVGDDVLILEEAVLGTTVNASTLGRVVSWTAYHDSCLPKRPMPHNDKGKPRPRSALERTRPALGRRLERFVSERTANFHLITTRPT